MAFLRVKKQYKSEYLYLRENEWRQDKRTHKKKRAPRGFGDTYKKRGKWCRTKSDTYLGKITTKHLVPNFTFEKYIKKEKKRGVGNYVDKTDYKDIIDDLIRYCSFLLKIEEIKPNTYYRLNEGYFGEYTINALKTFRSEQHDNALLIFSELFLDCGLDPSNKTLFVKLFKKENEENKISVDDFRKVHGF